MSNSSQIHNLLYGGFSKQSKASLTASHNVLMVTKNIQRASSQSTCRNMENARQQLAGNFVHVRNHEQQPLGSGKGSSQCASLQGAVYSTCCASLGLHFYNANLLTKKVLSTLGRPFVHNLSHRRRRSNRIDTSNIGKCIRDVRSSGVAIHGFHFCH